MLPKKNWPSKKQVPRSGLKKESAQKCDSPSPQGQLSKQGHNACFSWGIESITWWYRVSPIFRVVSGDYGKPWLGAKVCKLLTLWEWTTSTGQMENFPLAWMCPSNRPHPQLKGFLFLAIWVEESHLVNLWEGCFQWTELDLEVFFCCFADFAWRQILPSDPKPINQRSGKQYLQIPLEFCDLPKVFAAHRSRVVGWTNLSYGKWLGNLFNPVYYVQLSSFMESYQLGRQKL